LPESDLLARAAEASPDGITLADVREPDQPLIYVNPAFEALSGYAREEILGQNCRVLQADDRDQPAVAELRDAIAERRPAHVLLRNYRRDGRLFWNELHMAPVRNSAGITTHFVGIQQDVTRREHLRQALTSQEALFRSLFESAGMGILLTDVEGRIWRTNEALAEMLGWPAETLKGWNIDALIAEADREAGQADRHALLRGETDRISRERRYRHADGSTVWALVEARAVRDSHGRPEYLVGMVSDITDRKADEEERQQLLDILEAAPDIIGIADTEGRLVYRNASGWRMLGMPEEAGLPGDPIEQFHPDWARRRVAEEGLPTAAREGMWQGEAAMINAAGDEVPVAQVILAHYDRDGAVRHYSTLIRDISAQKAEEERLRASETIYRRIIESAREGFELIHQSASGSTAARDKFPVDHDGGVDFLDVADIQFLQADGNYAVAFTRSRHFLSGFSLAEAERRLTGKGFLRCHRSYLVNPDHVHSMRVLDGQTYLVMATDKADRIPVSRRNLESVRAALGLS